MNSKYEYGRTGAQLLPHILHDQTNTHTHTASLAAQHVQADVVQPLSTHTLVSLALRHVQAEVLLAVGKHILQLFIILS